MAICTQGDCPLASFNADTAVWCDNTYAEDTCKQSEFTGTQVDCDVGSCENSRFTESSAVCHGLSCHLDHFDRTTVDCDPNHDIVSSENTCMQASIFAPDIIVATHSLDIADLEPSLHKSARIALTMGGVERGRSTNATERQWSLLSGNALSVVELAILQKQRVPLRRRWRNRSL